MKHPDNLYTILRGMIREEIDQTPGFRELAGRSDLPASVDAEKAILGAVLLDGNVRLDGLTAEDYSLDSHRKIFVMMDTMRQEGAPVDIVTLAEALGQDGCKEVGGVAYLASLTEGLPRNPAIGEYVRIIQEKSKLRRIWQACEDAIRKCGEQQESAAGIVAELGVALKGIRGGKK